MNCLIFVALSISATVNAGIIALPAKIVQGPASRTTISGPDGSVISSISPGGQIVTEEHVGVVAHTAPVAAYAVPVVHSAPLVTAYASPVVAAKTTVSEFAHTLVSNHVIPTHVDHVEPVIAAAYAAPAVTAQAATATPTNATISESDENVTSHRGPVVAVSQAPVDVEPVVAGDAPVARHHEPVVAHAAPVIASKTVISESAQTISHGTHLVAAHTPIVVEPVLATRTAPVLAAIQAPVVATHSAPAIASRTTISESGQAVSHGTGIVSVPAVQGIPVVAAYVQPVVGVQTVRAVSLIPAVPVVNVHATLPLSAVESTVVAGPAGVISTGKSSHHGLYV